ncbi:Uncharacterized membrane protein YdjX, TVP38/TMEM64 family, SNARE-associated domain [Malonomonas rubra DSM 5091]|uniref:Uncharacterized membrane protein YdjX, TVP38/TMEM64 family, SNARE-associated domain n=1 Tax=Malonomonas rubra DSM 5091 TaxID=1122189 RepID=A0A1M6C0L0_MALRU|nr:VTT domain-containing protein [Malonomonas rubra]SHI54589.1 Uncharacterized membrane protein YdjX, TVP38/TMEM64 family, SNARE-associated domain [Malonomonas rubra DSM 5091]
MSADAIPSTRLRAPLQKQLNSISSDCTQCGLCVRECAFLEKYGDPKKMADNYSADSSFHLGLAFECSLCGLCAAVCPHQLNPETMFLEMRRETVDRGAADYPEHKGLLNYERRGTSKSYSWYSLPADCDTIFFPGCALTGSRPQQTLKTFELLQQRLPTIGIVLDCCTKPSHDLGREDYFYAMFGEMKAYLQQQGIKTVLVACPNCYQVFTEYAPDFRTLTVYEQLAEMNLPAVEMAESTKINIHDPCVARFSVGMQDAVRDLARKQGLTIEESKHHRQTTLCCGEGGAVGAMAPELAKSWTEKRASESTDRTLTYCAACSHKLSDHRPTSHILDMVLEPAAALNDKSKVSKAPMTYWNRIKVKRQIQKQHHAAVTRERTFTADNASNSGAWGKVALLALVVAAIVAVRTTGAMEYLEQERLRELIAGYGLIAPLVYMAIFCLAPVLLLPGLPIGIAGAILFGPIWGVIYTITSATVGAGLAFLVSRYLARDWIESKLNSPRWRQLDEKVELHGWKMVAFTRLIPLFPFNLLNYAFGLTKVKFSHYLVASFIFMLPGTIAFITFSSSLLELIRGEISPTFLTGFALMLLMSALPLIHRRYQSSKQKIRTTTRT